jgi:transposase
MTLERDEILALIQTDPEAIVTIIQTLEKRIADLERQLNMNSRNSSRPPSTDGFKRPQKKRKRTGKLPGGQEGHKGHTLEWCENPDIIKTYRVPFCEGCGASLEGVPAKSVDEREDYDIPEPQIIVTKHIAETVVCPRCGQSHKGSFPADISAHLQYGPNIRALMVYLSTYQLLPYERAAEIFSDLYGCSPVKATLMKSISDCATNLEGFENQVKHLLSEASVLCADETGLRVEGKREWLHTASTDRLTLYGHHLKRGSEAMDAIGVLPEFNGTMVHDCWSPYFGYACTHAVCNAHILRDLQGISENYDQKWSDELHDLLLEIYAAVKEAPESAVSLEEDEMEDFRRRFDQILDSGEKENPQPPPPVQQGKRGRKKRTRAENLILRCRKYRDEILRFMTDFRVPFTNNLAERDIRMVKVQQKISGTFRSREGATNFCRVRGYISTVRKNGEAVLMAIGGAFRGEPFMPSVA